MLNGLPQFPQLGKEQKQGFNHFKSLLETIRNTGAETGPGLLSADSLVCIELPGLQQD